MNTKFLRLLVEELKAASAQSVKVSHNAHDSRDAVLATGAASTALVSSMIADCIDNALKKMEGASK